MDLRLLVLQGKPQGSELPVHHSPFVIGRGPECHLRPNSDMVSRRHCALIIHGREVHIRDLGSTNGTIVDGERLTQDLILADGDIFQVGPLIFQVVIRDTVQADQPTVGPAPNVAQSTQRERGAEPNAKIDEIVQWLVSDSKNDIPTSGSGVYSGETVFTAGAPEKQPHSPDPAVQDPHPVEAAEPKPHDIGRKGDEKPNKPVEATGAAAHAAEHMLRQFMHRRPRIGNHPH
jgi:pSer/pThr/pTyr-binding forkhead associated (FHA) protein